MTTEKSLTEDSVSIAASMAGSHVQAFLRLEGLAAAALSAVFYQRTGASWWLFAALWLAPDLSMLGYLGGPKLGARIYNAIHSYVTPATLAVTGLLLHSPAVLLDALGQAGRATRSGYSGKLTGASVLDFGLIPRISARATSDTPKLIIIALS